MATADDLESLLSTMSPSGRARYNTLRSEIRACKDRITECDDELARLAVAYGVPRLDLPAGADVEAVRTNELWRICTSDWRCPCCARSKQDCIRADAQGRRHGILVVHHDHMTDALDAALADIGREAVSAATAIDESARRFLSRFKNAFSRFDEIVICQDCNTCDGAAKALLGAHTYFTFTPREIASFARSAAGNPHSIDQDRVRSAYEKALPLFEVRMEAARRLARRVFEGTLWYEHHDYSTHPDRLRALASTQLSLFGFGEASIWRLFQLAKSQERLPQDKSGWRTRRKAFTTDAPSAKDIALVKAMGGWQWDAVPATWQCPCCGRSKEQCIRMNKQKKLWMFMAGERAFFDPDAPHQRRTVFVCDACSIVAKELGTELNSKLDRNSFDGPITTLNELVRVIRPRPFSLHEVDLAQAEALIVEKVNQWTFE